MPSSGARSGTRPSRPGPVGRGRVGGLMLRCGHLTHQAEPTVRTFEIRKALYTCPDGCGLQRRKG
jgi:hypothetical protein